jgi:hypothetical protein
MGADSVEANRIGVDEQEEWNKGWVGSAPEGRIETGTDWHACPSSVHKTEN